MMVTEAGGLPVETAAARGSGRRSRNEHLACGLLHAPAAKRIKCGRAQCGPGAQTETGVVQGTSNGVVYDEAQGQRAVIVRALSADRKVLLAAPYQDRFYGIDPARDDPPIGISRISNPARRSGRVERSIFLPALL